MFDRFTVWSQHVVVRAEQESGAFNHRAIGTEHLLLGLAYGPDGLARQMLTDMGVSHSMIRRKVGAVIAHDLGEPLAERRFTPQLKDVFEGALRQMAELGHSHINPEHLLLGLLRETDCVANQLLIKLDVNPGELYRSVLAAVRAGSS